MCINVKLAIASFALIPIMLIYALFLNKRMKRAFKRNRARIAEINAGIEDNLSGIRVVKSFANEDLEQEKFRQGNERFLESKDDSYKCMGQYHAGLGAFVTLITVVVIVTAAFLLNGNDISSTDLLTFLLYISNFTEPVKTLINFAEQFQNGITGYERFLDIMSIEPDIQDSEGAVEMSQVEGRVTFKDVSFKYEEDLDNVLSNVTLNVDKGEYIALVGSSGAGKQW